MSPHTKPDLSDPLQMAVKVTAVEGTLALLQQQVSSGLGNISSRLDAVQADQRAGNNLMTEVARQQQAMESHNDGLKRAFGAIEQLAREFGGWRERHEDDNTAVSKSVTTFRGVLIGFGLLSALVVSCAVWIVRDGFQREAADRARLETKLESDVNRLERRTDAIGADVRELQDVRRLK